jgi:hypothetical protein
MKQSAFDTHDVKKCCEKKLDISFRAGKEFNGWFRLDGKKTARITVAKGRKNIHPKTYKSMAAQLKLNIQQFDELLECPLGQDGYEKILRNILDKSSN